MRQVRKRLTYANVMSSLAVFLILGGATAFAAKKIGSNQLKANSVGTAKIKRNAVTTTKIKKNAITTAKIKDGAVNGAKIADGSVTGADIDAASTSFSRIVARFRATGAMPFPPSGLPPFPEYPLSNATYTQNAGEDLQFIGAVDVTFDAACEAPRAAQVTLMVDTATPGVPSPPREAGMAVAGDEGSGTVTRRAEFTPAIGGLSRLAPNTATQHTFSIVPGIATCKSGSGITATAAGVDVIGTK